MHPSARALMFALAIPVIGFLVGNSITAPFDAEATAAVGRTMQEVCALAGDRPEFRSACESYSYGRWLRSFSLSIGLLGVGLIAVASATAAFAGRNRDRNATLFPVLMPIAIIGVAALILGSGAIAVALAVRYLPISFVVAAIGFGALGASLGLIAVLFRLLTQGRNQRHAELAAEIREADQPRLWQRICEIAGKLGTPAPNNLIIGLNPNFYATVAPTAIPGSSTPLQGQTLYLSLPLTRLLSEEELNAIIGHELAHFRGADGRYSQRFAPVYRGLSMALQSVAEGTRGLRSIALIPAHAILRSILELFASNEREISRDREYEADRAAIQIASPAAMANALVKVAVFARFWQKVRQENVERLQHGRLVPHLAEIFHDTARWDVRAIDRQQLLSEVAEHQVAHPFDTHPTVRDRLQAVGVEIGSLTPSELLHSEPWALNLLDAAPELDARLSMLEHQMMVALGQAPASNDAEPSGNPLLSRVYLMAAALIGADGQLDAREIDTAERIGRRMFPGFDAIEFRWTCQRSAQLPSFSLVAEELQDVLLERHKQQIIHYLEAIADADGNVDESERALLDELEERWGWVPGVGESDGAKTKA